MDGYRCLLTWDKSWTVHELRRERDRTPREVVGSISLVNTLSTEEEKHFLNVQAESPLMEEMFSLVLYI